MADFDVGTVPELAQQRLDATAADCQTQGQKMFEEALADQRKLLVELAKPIGPIMDATAKRAAAIAAGPPAPPAEPSTSPTTAAGS